MRRGDFEEDSYCYPPSRPIQAEGGIKASSRRGAFGRSWWAARWIEAMERLLEGGRLSRGRSYARRGQVLSIEETKDGVKARVQGSRRTPYRITLRISPLNDEHWERVIDAMADQALFAAQLLAGEMPQDIEQAFISAGVSLFPEHSNDLVTECSCPDWSNPCKHVAAVHYILAERFDEDPFLLFRLRGRGQEYILDSLRRRRACYDTAETEQAAADESEEVVPLEETIGSFWKMGEGMDGFNVSIRPARVPLPVLKRLGQPAFMGEVSLEKELGPAYDRISHMALALTFSDVSGESGG